VIAASRKTAALLAILALSHAPHSAYAVVDQIIRLLDDRSSTSQTYAVVIGIDAYKQAPDLHYAVNDARSMVKLFRALRFNVPDEAILLRSSHSDDHISAADVKTVVRNVLRMAGSKDNVYVFFSGHGEEAVYRSGSKEAYLLPSDGDPSDLPGTALAFTTLVKSADLTDIQARQVLFILDACYAADALRLEGLRSVEQADPLDESFFRELLEGRVVAAVTAGGEGQTVREIGGHGVFTKHLIRGLLGYADTNGNGAIRFSELITWIEPVVYQASGEYKQRVKAGTIGYADGEVVFRVPPSEVAKRLLSTTETKRLKAEMDRRRAALESSREGLPPLVLPPVVAKYDFATTEGADPHWCDDFKEQALNTTRWSLKKDALDPIFVRNGVLNFTAPADRPPSEHPLYAWVQALPAGPPVSRVSFTTKLESYEGDASAAAGLEIFMADRRQHSMKVGPGPGGPAIEFYICNKKLPPCDGNDYNDFSHPGRSHFDVGVDVPMEVRWTRKALEFSVDDVLRAQTPTYGRELTEFRFSVYASRGAVVHAVVDNVCVTYAED
jgi:uncharacterized caspase-like protein